MKKLLFLLLIPLVSFGQYEKKIKASDYYGEWEIMTTSSKYKGKMIINSKGISIDIPKMNFYNRVTKTWWPMKFKGLADYDSLWGRGMFSLKNVTGFGYNDGSYERCSLVIDDRNLDNGAFTLTTEASVQTVVFTVEKFTKF